MLGWCSVIQLCRTVWPQGPSPARPLCPWDFPSKNTGVDCHFLLQRILLTQESNLSFLCLLHWQIDSLPLSHLGSLLHINMGPLKGISIPTGLQMPFSGRRAWKLHLSCKKVLSVQLQEGYWLSFLVAHLSPTTQMGQQLTSMWVQCYGKSQGLQSCPLYRYYYSSVLPQRSYTCKFIFICLLYL